MLFNFQGEGEQKNRVYFVPLCSFSLLLRRRFHAVISDYAKLFVGCEKLGGT